MTEIWNSVDTISSVVSLSTWKRNVKVTYSMIGIAVISNSSALPFMLMKLISMFPMGTTF